MEERQHAGKVQSSAAEAIADIAHGCSLAVGGFGLCGTPVDLIEAVRNSGVMRTHDLQQQLRLR